MFNKSTSCNGLGTNLLVFECFEGASAEAPLATIFNGFWCWRLYTGSVVLFLLLETLAFSAFRRQRFGIFSGCCFAWFGHESCCCSAVSQAVRQRLWTLETLPRRAFWKRCAVFAVGDFSANFSAFRRQRFGIFSGCCFAWFGHESCCCSAVSQAVRQRLWTLETLPRQAFWKRCAVFAVGDFSTLVHSVGNVSAFFLVAVSHGLGTNPACNDFRCFASWSTLYWKRCAVFAVGDFACVRAVGDVSAFFLVAVSHGLGTNPAAVRLFRTRSAKGFGR